jgi:hypothetical protein
MDPDELKRPPTYKFTKCAGDGNGSRGFLSVMRSNHPETRVSLNCSQLSRESPVIIETEYEDDVELDFAPPFGAYGDVFNRLEYFIINNSSRNDVEESSFFRPFNLVYSIVALNGSDAKFRFVCCVRCFLSISLPQRIPSCPLMAGTHGIPRS